MLFHRDGHRGGGLARADHERSARRRMGKVTRKDLERIGSGDRGLKALCEQLFRIHASTLALAGGGADCLHVHHLEHRLEQTAFGVADLVEHREMIFPRARYVRLAQLAPFFPDEPVLHVESLGFLRAHRGIEGGIWGRREKRRAYFQRGSPVEAHITIHRGYLDDLRQVVQAADGHRGADDLLRQVWRVVRPAAAEHHGGQMPPCVRLAEVVSVGGRAEILSVTVQPRAGLYYLYHDVFDSHRGAKSVVGHRDRDPGLGERRRDERKALLVERTPISAVDVHQKPPALSLGAEDVHFFRFARAVRHVQVAVEAGAGPLRLFSPAIEDLLIVLDYEPRIVEKVVVCLVRVHLAVPERRSRRGSGRTTAYARGNAAGFAAFG